VRERCAIDGVVYGVGDCVYLDPVAQPLQRSCRRDDVWLAARCSSPGGIRDDSLCGASLQADGDAWAKERAARLKNPAIYTEVCAMSTFCPPWAAADSRPSHFIFYILAAGPYTL
jgi:hypothetical protein